MANALAIPYVSLLIVPWCLLATLFTWVLPPLAPALWWCGAKLLTPLWLYLQWLAAIPASVWQHKLTGVEALWLGLAMLGVLAPRGWIGRSLALFLLVPVCWPKQDAMLSQLSLTVPRHVSQTVAVLHQGHVLMPLVVAPGARTKQRVERWCQGVWQCRPAVEGATIVDYKLHNISHGLMLENGRQWLVFLPKATAAQLDHFIKHSAIKPHWIVYGSSRRQCYLLAQQLHRAYPSSILLTKGCPGGQRLLAPTSNTKNKQILPGFYSTARNGSITIPLS